VDGTVVWFDPDRHHGRILGTDEREYFVREDFLDGSTTSEMLVSGTAVEFVVSESDRGPQAHEVRLLAVDKSDDEQVKDAEHLKHCFVVMPFGRDTREARWFRGWYETVIQPAVIRSGFDPVLSATERAPNAINDEIRAHLVFDPMVVVDLGGASADDSPNPNVMYELGIRHALNLPLVMMSWDGQRLPFDISNQRVIIGRRELLDIEPTKEHLVSFIESARKGQFYRPMDAIGRIATIDRAAESLGSESLLGVLAKEVRDLRRSVARRTPDAQMASHVSPSRKKADVRTLLAKEDRKQLYLVHTGAGGDDKSWTKFLHTPLADFGGDDDPRQWTTEDWNKAVTAAGDTALHDRESKAAETLRVAQAINEKTAEEPGPYSPVSTGSEELAPDG
jgi:cold shock CspA family protein